MTRYLRRLCQAVVLMMTMVLAQPALGQAAATLSSPDRHLTLNLSFDGDGRAYYAVNRDGHAIIARSQLGFQFTDQLNFNRALTLESAETSSADSQWEQPWGERRFVRDRHNQLAVMLKENGGDRRLRVVFRLFDDGLGFRYEFPGRWGAVHIQDELTEFTVAQPGTAWWIVGGDWNRYEQLYQTTAIDAVATAHTPITMRLADGTHLAFHEAALVDYSAMWFRRTDGQRFKATLSPSGSGPRVSRIAPFPTPWRTIIIAPDASGLVESNIELNLNEPNALGDVSWVHPYRYIGIWWGMHLNQWSWATGPHHGATTENARRYIDFAAAHGFRGVLIEGWNRGWDGNWFGHGDDFSFTEATPDFDIDAVTAYARQRGVHLVGHHETGGNIAVYEPQLEAAMALYERLGVDSVKTGYVADAGGIISRTADGQPAMEWHDGQVMARHHLHVVEVAARHHIAIDAHEPIKDTGLRRTYPNWVSREGARGMEYNAWGEPGNGPDHEVNLVYTRMLSGPMDYTPGILSLKGRDGRDLASTRARQLALYITLYSPIQMAADLIENLERFPRELGFISAVPTNWAESHLVAGTIGDFALFARKDRASEGWYLGGITNAQGRDFSQLLSFLDPGKRYTATIYADGPQADFRTDHRGDIIIDSRIVTAADSIAIHMAPGGGVAVRLTPIAAARRR